MPTLKVDNEGPTISNVEITDLTPSSVTIKVDVSDSYSGVCWQSFIAGSKSTDGQQTGSSYTVTLDGLSEGTNYIGKIGAEDYAGNQSNYEFSFTTKSWVLMRTLEPSEFGARTNYVSTYPEEWLVLYADDDNCYLVTQNTVTFDIATNKNYGFKMDKDRIFY